MRLPELFFGIAALLIGVAQAQPGDPVVAAMEKASDNANRSLPRMLDRETRADSTYVGPGRVWTFAVTALNLTSRDIDERALRAEYGDTVVRGVCTAPFMRVFLENNVKVVYLYRGYDGGYIGSISVLASQCKGD